MQARLSSPESGTRAGVLLRSDRFDLMTRVLGCGSDLARARFFNLDPKTLWSARQGRVGEKFIAQVLLVLGMHEAELAPLGLTPTFEELFEVRQKAAV
jgi:hypothetical protein